VAFVWNMTVLKVWIAPLSLSSE